MSEIKVNKISPRSGTTVTLGDSGDTFTIPAGATINNQGTATNFGATGSASWETTVKTGDFTAVAGEGYFVNTTSGAINVTLPAGTAGAVVAIKDYAGTFDTNNLTLTRNGSDKIGGQAVNATITTEGIAITLVFVDSTQGWLVTDSGLQDEAPTATFITATGGTTTTDGNFKIHTFTGPGTFCVSAVGNPFGSDTVSYMVVAGGASAGLGDSLGAGGGAGGFREGRTTTCSYTASPLNAPAGLPVSATSFPITVGAGGSAPSTGSPSKPGNSGSNSSFSTITSAGGGAGGGWPDVSGTNGGSGGGSGNGGNTKGDGNTPPVSPPQGLDGGNRCNSGCGVGGGGGATVAGSDASTSNSSGGAGATTSINGSATAFAGGGGGASVFPGPAKAGGTGGGGPGGYPGAGTNGTTNTGGGGGGNGPVSTSAGNGGSGIVIIRYKFQ